MSLRSLSSALRASVLLVGLAACSSGSHGAFVWIDDYAPAKAPATGYVVGVGDVLNIQAYELPSIATRERVRPDGKIAMPLLGDVTVVDKTPAALALEIERTLKDRNLVNDPRIAVHVDEVKPLAISVLGKVARPGAYVVESGASVAQALASAGGLSEFANKSQIYLNRAPSVRLRFTFDQVTGESGIASQFRVKNGDVIVVY